nr:unnamed protein product [Callosobruchus analis]
MATVERDRMANRMRKRELKSP